MLPVLEEGKRTKVYVLIHIGTTKNEKRPRNSLTPALNLRKELGESVCVHHSKTSLDVLECKI
jgi:hypothetical protein